jgi:hypothetical protein
MSLYNALLIALSFVMALAAVVMCLLAVYGSFRMKLLRVDRKFGVKRRIELALFGLLLLVVAFTQLAGVAGLL